MRAIPTSLCFVIAASMALPWSAGVAADCPAPALHGALLGNLVKVNLPPASDGKGAKEGFGFVIDADADGYTVATARHVVARGRDGRGAMGEGIRVGVPPRDDADPGAASRFDGAYPATPLRSASPDVARAFADRDLALLRLDREAPLRFEARVLSPASAAEGETLCIVGQPRTDSREARPRLTSEPFGVFERTAHPVRGPRLFVGGVREVVNGHSGAPIFGERGLVGMVTDRSSGKGLALEIGEIRRLVESDGRTFGLAPAPRSVLAPPERGGVPRALKIAGIVLAGALVVGLATSSGGDDDGRAPAGTTLLVPTP